MCGGCDAVKPGGEWKGRMQLQMIFPMQSGCKSYNSKLKGSGPPLPLLGQAVSHCFTGDYISILPLGDVNLRPLFPAGGVPPVLAYWGHQEGAEVW